MSCTVDPDGLYPETNGRTGERRCPKRPRGCGATSGMDGIGYLWVVRAIEHLMVASMYCIVFQFCILPLISECEGSSVLADYACNYCLQFTDNTILLTSQKSKDGAGQHTHSDHLLSNFLTVHGFSAVRVNQSHPAFLLLSHLDFCCHPGNAITILSRTKQSSFPPPGCSCELRAEASVASLLPGQTDHLCPGGNPTQWL